MARLKQVNTAAGGVEVFIDTDVVGHSPTFDERVSPTRTKSPVELIEELKTRLRQLGVNV